MKISKIVQAIGIRALGLYALSTKAGRFNNKIGQVMEINRELAKLGCILHPDLVEVVRRYALEKAGDDTEIYIRILKAEYTMNLCGDFNRERYEITEQVECPDCYKAPSDWSYDNVCEFCDCQFTVTATKPPKIPMVEVRKVTRD